MTIVGPDFRLARLESGRGVNGVAGSQGNVGGGERISMAVLRNSDSVTGIRFVPLHHPNAPRAFGSASACFTPMSSLLTSFCGRLRPCRRPLGECTRGELMITPVKRGHVNLPGNAHR